ncbi:MAG TPA: dienelactone hydrolase family protein [Caulobacteraceae bacterium]|jgi:phospholipase/carboxylesterase|nr:dienelactone hydrolase family protein [Caulobacteraceae bacterium]
MRAPPALNGPRLAPASGGDPKSIVIFTHGYGSNGEDLIGLAPHWREALPDTVFVSPNAPEAVPGYPGGYQWWAIGGPDRVAGVRGAAPVLDAFIDAELARYGLTEERLALVGFSQGTMMALHVGPRRKRPLAGIVGYSGALVDPTADDILTRPPILLAHGDADPMVPVAAFNAARDALQRQGFEVAGHVSPGLGHSIDLPGLTLGQRFLTRVLG